MADVTESPSILAIHAHPDDVEIQCGGTLHLLSKTGANLTIVTMTPGDCGSAVHSPDQIAAIRRAEAAAAAEMVGAEYHCLEFRDLSIVHDNDSRQRVTELLRRVNPTIVLTAPPVDYMSDHEVTSRLVRDACFNASVPNYSTRQWEPAAAMEKIPHLYYVDPLEGADWFQKPIPPGFVVDISSVIEEKLKMLAFHASQREWLRSQHGIDEYLEGTRRWSALRGQEIGVEYGEGFTQHTGHPYPGHNLLQKLLQDATDSKIA